MICEGPIPESRAVADAKKGAGLSTGPRKLNDQRSGSRCTELLACLVVLVNR